MTFNSLIPELSVSDINKSKEFYLNLCFSVLYERPENNFAMIGLEENQIMIDQINGNWEVGTMEYPFGRGINLSMHVSDVEGLYNNLKAKNVKIYRELKVH